MLRLLNLAEPVQVMLMAGDIDMGHARALLALDRATQITAANQISAKKLSVREAESLVKKLSAEFNLVPQKPKKEKTRDMKRVEEELSDLLTAQVEVRVKKRVKRNGKLEDMGEVAIQFGSLDALNGLIDAILALGDLGVCVFGLLGQLGAQRVCLAHQGFGLRIFLLAVGIAGLRFQLGDQSSGSEWLPRSKRLMLVFPAGAVLA